MCVHTCAYCWNEVVPSETEPKWGSGNSSFQGPLLSVDMDRTAPVLVPSGLACPSKLSIPTSFHVPCTPSRVPLKNYFGI